MKIIFLNTWLGRFPERLAAFLAEHAADTDVFCFQEASRDFQTLCSRLLPEHDPFVSDKTLLLPENGSGAEVPYWYVLASYTRRGLAVSDRGTLLAEDPRLGIAHFLSIPYGGSTLEIVNVHGVSIPGKHDNPDRLRQFRAIRDHAAGRPGLAVIGGDLNVLPETESARMFGAEYRDLISEFRIPTTRNRYAWEKHPGSEMYFSDYAFVDPALSVRNFSVIEGEISDHLPLILELDDSLHHDLAGGVQ